MVDLGTFRGRAAYGTTLMFVMVAATFLYFTVGVLSPILRTELGLSAFQLGLLGTVINGIAALAAPFVGSAVDSLGGRRIAAALLGVSGLSIIGFGFASTYGWLLIMAGVNGLAAAGSNPATNHMLFEHLSAGRRGLMLGVKQSGVRVGQLLAGALLPAGVLAMGRGPTLAIPGVACLLGVIAMFMFVPPSSGNGSQRRQSQTRAPLGSTVWWLVAFALLMGIAMSGVLLYLPLFSFDVLGFSAQGAGLTLGVLGMLGLFARVAAGPVAERFSTPAIPLVVMSIGSALSIGLVWAAEPWMDGLVWVGVIVLGLTGAVWNTVANLAVITSSSGERTGRASGMLHTAYLGGLSIGPLLAGAILDATGSYAIAWLEVGLLFLAAALVSGQWLRTTRGKVENELAREV